MQRAARGELLNNIAINYYCQLFPAYAGDVSLIYAYEFRLFLYIVFLRHSCFLQLESMNPGVVKGAVSMTDFECLYFGAVPINSP